MKHFIKEYWVEIIALVAVAGGVLFVVDLFGLKQAVGVGMTSIRLYAGSLGELFAPLFSDISLSDLIIWVAVVMAGLFVLWRMRYRFRKSHRWVADECPVCGEPLVRIHRSPLDRVISKILLPHARRYLCKNLTCRWSGLRYGRPKRSPNLIDEAEGENA